MFERNTIAKLAALGSLICPSAAQCQTPSQDPEPGDVTITTTRVMEMRVPVVQSIADLLKNVDENLDRKVAVMGFLDKDGVWISSNPDGTGSVLGISEESRSKVVLQYSKTKRQLHQIWGRVRIKKDGKPELYDVYMLQPAPRSVSDAVIAEWSGVPLPPTPVSIAKEHPTITQTQEKSLAKIHDLSASQLVKEEVLFEHLNERVRLSENIPLQYFKTGIYRANGKAWSSHFYVIVSGKQNILVQSTKSLFPSGEKKGMLAKGTVLIPTHNVANGLQLSISK